MGIKMTDISDTTDTIMLSIGSISISVYFEPLF